MSPDHRRRWPAEEAPKQAQERRFGIRRTPRQRRRNRLKSRSMVTSSLLA
ncbi:hypothetical protein I553_5088 [Mycobacterium xenopi 4042]|uniref:Uncharacterized protein n=1 Tax=Mycobacterium xenopi 4042 TaxID=1299334 RepID=X7ZX49_MYCXE|nr:hypothetical protein I553_5088 [Mycobacterium xenopi 4042]